MQAQNIISAKKAIRQSIKAALKQLTPAMMAEESKRQPRKASQHGGAAETRRGAART